MNGSWETAVADVAARAEKATGEMYGWLGKHRGVSPRAKLEVWTATVGAVLRYGSEVWFPGVLGERRLEAVQLGFLKKVLRVSSGTRSWRNYGRGSCMSRGRQL